jgi:hypothetical protein
MVQHHHILPIASKHHQLIQDLETKCQLPTAAQKVALDPCGGHEMVQQHHILPIALV